MANLLEKLKTEFNLTDNDIHSARQLLKFDDDIHDWLNQSDSVFDLNDLDSFPFDRKIIVEMVNSGYIRTWTENARGISFECWDWTKKALDHFKCMEVDFVELEHE